MAGSWKTVRGRLIGVSLILMCTSGNVDVFFHNDNGLRRPAEKYQGLCRYGGLFRNGTMISDFIRVLVFQ